MSERVVRRGLRVNILAGSLGMAFVAVAAGVPFTMLLVALGASGVQLGLAVTVQQWAMLVSIPSALVAGRLETRKTFWAALALLHRVLWFVPALLPLLWTGSADVLVGVVIAVAGVSALCAHASAPVWWSWMTDLVPARISGRFWGERQSAVMAAFLVMTGLSGWVLDRAAGGPSGRELAGFAMVFGGAALLGVIDIVVHLWVPEPPQLRNTQRARLAPRIRTVMRQPGFVRLSLAMGAWMFALGVTGGFQLVYLTRAFGVSYSQLSLLAIVGSLGTVASGLVLGLLMDRIGARALGRVLILVGPTMGTVWFFMGDAPVAVPWFGGARMVPQPVAVLGVVNFLAGGLYSGVHLGQLRMLGRVCAREERTLSMAVHWTLVGLLGAMGPILGGVIMDGMGEGPLGPGPLLTGLPISFYHVLVLVHMGVCWGVVAPLWRGLPQDGHGTDAPAAGGIAGMLRPGNPLRALSGLYGLWQSIGPSSGDVRARAIQRVGESGLAFSVPDLDRRLSDPDPRVREQAARALGDIGGGAAAEALVRELGHPESDLWAAAARALGQCRDPRGVELLRLRLREGDGEVARECARALGAIGDRRAVPDLRAILAAAGDLRLRAAAAGALAQLGEPDAVPDMLAVMRAAGNPALRRGLAVAVADLLGTPGTFYRMLMREEEAAGSEAARMIRGVERLLRRGVGGRLADLAGEAAAIESSLETAAPGETIARLHALALACAARFADASEDGRKALERLDPAVAAALRGLALPDAAPAPADRKDERLLAAYAVHRMGHRLARRRAMRSSRVIVDR